MNMEQWGAVADRASKTEKKIPAKGIDEQGDIVPVLDPGPSDAELKVEESLMNSLEALVPDDLSETAEVKTEAAQDSLQAALADEVAPEVAVVTETAEAEQQVEKSEKVPLQKLDHHAESPATFEDIAAYSVELTQAENELAGVLRLAQEGFAEAQGEYTKIQRSLRKIKPLVDGSWKEDPTVALHLIRSELSRITQNLNVLQEKVMVQNKKFEESFSDADTQEVLASTLGNLRKKTFDEEETPKRKGWWNTDGLFDADMQDEGLNVVPGPREKEEEIIEPLPELSGETKEEIAKMREQIARVTTTTNKRRGKVGLSHAEAKTESAGYTQARSVLLRMQNELKNIESTGVEVQSERMEQLRTQLAEALWDMKREFSGEEERDAEASDVYKKIRTEFETLHGNTAKLIVAYPELTEDPHYQVLQSKLQKLEGVLEDDDSIQRQYEIIRAVLANAARGYIELSEKASVEGLAADNVKTGSEAQVAVEAMENPEGLFAWGEKEKGLTESGKHLQALITEHEDLQDTAEYREAKNLFEELTAEGVEKTTAKLEAFTQSVRKLHTIGIQKKIEAKHVEAQANEPIVLTEAMRVDSSDSVGQHEEGIEAKVAEQLFGMEIPKEGADGWFGARAFHEALNAITTRRPALLEDADIRKAINEIKFILQDLPQSGLTQDESVRIAELASVINMPESLLQKKPSSVEMMRAETERKLQEKLPALDGKKGGVKRKVTLGWSVVSGLLARKMSKKQSSK